MNVSPDSDGVGIGPAELTAPLVLPVRYVHAAAHAHTIGRAVSSPGSSARTPTGAAAISAMSLHQFGYPLADPWAIFEAPPAAPTLPYRPPPRLQHAGSGGQASATGASAVSARAGGGASHVGGGVLPSAGGGIISPQAARARALLAAGPTSTASAAVPLAAQHTFSDAEWSAGIEAMLFSSAAEIESVLPFAAAVSEPLLRSVRTPAADAAAAAAAAAAGAEPPLTESRWLVLHVIRRGLHIMRRSPAAAASQQQGAAASHPPVHAPPAAHGPPSHLLRAGSCPAKASQDHATGTGPAAPLLHVDVIAASMDATAAAAVASASAESEECGYGAQPEPDLAVESLEAAVLRLVEDLGRTLRAGRLTSCKSAKDRTGMAVTLEESRCIAQFEGAALALASAALTVSSADPTAGVAHTGLALLPTRVASGGHRGVGGGGRGAYGAVGLRAVRLPRTLTLPQAERLGWAWQAAFACAAEYAWSPDGGATTLPFFAPMAALLLGGGVALGSTSSPAALQVSRDAGVPCAHALP
jgi:hypothetical protein